LGHECGRAKHERQRHARPGRTNRTLGSDHCRTVARRPGSRHRPCVASAPTSNAECVCTSVAVRQRPKLTQTRC
jgi:hypothetical protein